MTTKNLRPASAFTPFRPPCCPNPNCDFHLPSKHWRWKRHGSYRRPSDRRRFPRFLCLSCRRSFSTRTFSTTYWLRKRELPAQVAQLSSNGAGLRQMARVLGTTHRTIGRHIARLGRHCLLFQARLLHDFQIEEPVVIDGFETFEYSQFFPFHMNLAVGQSSWFLYGFSDSPLRRKGRMTPAQKQRREQLEALHGRPDPKAVETGMKQLIGFLAEKAGTGTLEIRSDEHPAYPRAIEAVESESSSSRSLTIRHERTPSAEARTFENPLFPVNLMDLLIRHGHANHRRETIAFSKRRQAGLERLSILLVWRNMIKKRRENGQARSAAMELGLVDRLLEWKDVLRRRLFPKRVRLPAPWEAYYWRRVKTAVLGEGQAGHALEYAF